MLIQQDIKEKSRKGSSMEKASCGLTMEITMKESLKKEKDGGSVEQPKWKER